MKILFLLLLLFSTTYLFCQQSPGTPFAPFISRLKTSAQGQQIVLTWKNSSDLQGKKLIYRHSKEITDANFKDAELIATVSEKSESYTDASLTTNIGFYYAVLIQDSSGIIYKIFIPYRNKTTSSITIATAVAEKEYAAFITNMEAKVLQNKVIITFKSSKNDREIIIYRSIQPILKASDILKATFSETISSAKTTYTDTPIAGVDYYYAIIDSGLVDSGEIKFTAGQNTLKEPVQIPISSSTLGLPKSVKRSFPLPALNLLYGVETGLELEIPRPFLLPHMIPLKAETTSAVTKLISEMESFTPKEKEFEILSVDKTEDAAGDSASLMTIISTYLVTQKYQDGELKLKDFLQTNLSGEIQARAHFYLAQSYYFQNKYREAFLEFLLAEDFYYADVQPWLDVCFLKINEAK
jgi:hypothetical protein